MTKKRKLHTLLHMEVNRCSSEIYKIGCFDYQKAKNSVRQNVAPIFDIVAIIRSVEDPYGLDSWLIEVNNRNKRTYKFEVSSDCVYQPNLLAILSKNGLNIHPCYAEAVADHLLYQHRQCEDTDSIVYRNKVLGWYPFEGQTYYFYDKTSFGGNTAITTRKEFEFQRGDEATYLQFLKDTVFPSTELSLALAIGYSAVVVSRLNGEEADLGTILVNLCGTSSTGKSTAEMLMCSPFMNPEISNKNNGLCFTANNTLNAIFGRIDGVHGVPFVIDDITTNPHLKNQLMQFIYSLADGTHKGRLNGNGELCGGGLGWSGVAITSSETPILDYGEQYQGTKARVLHTQGIQWTKSAKESELVKSVVRKNYGFTGKEFADFVATIPMEKLCTGFKNSVERVKGFMDKTDNLTDRLANKFAAIHLTIELLNAKFAFGLSSDELIKRIIQCEQDSIEERDNALKAYRCVVDFIFRHEARFLEDRQTKENTLISHYDKEYRPNNAYGKIIKYSTHWEVHILEEITKEILEKNGLGGELRGIRQKWIERGLAKGDGDHNTRKYSIEGQVVRCDCLILKGGIIEPQGEQPPKAEKVAQPEIPVSTYEVDDSTAFDDLFGGEE